MTLLEECKALVENRDNWVFTEELRTIISRHEHDDWKGPWKCAKCGAEYDHFFPEWHNHSSGHGECSGTLIPYERRKGERRRA